MSFIDFAPLACLKVIDSKFYTYFSDVRMSPRYAVRIKPRITISSAKMSPRYVIRHRPNLAYKSRCNKQKPKRRKKASKEKTTGMPKAACLVVVPVARCLDPPPRPLGYVYGGSDEVRTRIEVAAYLDPTCPDSQAVFPTLIQVAETFQASEAVKLRLHLFPLPYHRNSHTISKAAHVLDTFRPGQDMAFKWLNTTYANIDQLTTGGTVKETDIQVLDFLTGLATKLTGISATDFQNGVNNREIDLATRLEWKYGCTRGVYGTPMFTVNDVFVEATTWDLKQWLAYLNKLLQ